jgi:hypothetical protein
MDDGHDEAPPPEGWRSASQMKQASRHGIPVLSRTLAAVRDELIAEAYAASHSPDEAKAYVEREKVGYHKPKAGGISALYAAPEVWAIVFDRLPPPAPENWRSYAQLHRDGYRSGPGRLSRKLASARNTLIGDMASAGFDQALAQSLVDTHLIGCKNPPGSRGTGTLYASPDAVAWMERENILRRGAAGKLQEERPSNSSHAIASHPVALNYLRTTQRLVESGDLENAAKFYALIADAFPDTKEANRALTILGKLHDSAQRSTQPSR